MYNINYSHRQMSLFSFSSLHSGSMIVSIFFTLSLSCGRITFSRKIFGLSGLALITTGFIYWSTLPRFSIEESVAVAVRGRCAAFGNKQVSSPSFLNFGLNCLPEHPQLHPPLICFPLLILLNASLLDILFSVYNAEKNNNIHCSTFFGNFYQLKFNR